MTLHIYVLFYRHVSQLDKPSKRYRNVHADVFVIADEDDNGMYSMYVFVVCGRP